HMIETGDYYAFFIEEILECRGAEALLPLRKLLADRQPRVRQRALTALKLLGDASAPGLPDVLDLLKDEDPQVRGAAVQCIGSMGEAARDAVAPLTALAADPDELLRYDAILALGHIGAPAATAARVIGHALEGDRLCRLAACEALAALGPAAEPALPRI